MDEVLCEMCGRTVPIEEAVEQLYPEDLWEVLGAEWWACCACVAECARPAEPTST